MAPSKRDSSQDSLHKGMGEIKDMLSQLLKENKNNSSSSTGESSGNGNNNDSTRKRAASADEDEGGKRKRTEDALFECTLCDGKYKKEWSLFRHYKGIHEEESPERVHQKNLAKRAQKKSNSNKSEKEMNCKLCEATFNSTSARNSHYTGKHRIKNEKALFFPDKTALVESPLKYEISKNPEWFKKIVKRNMPSRVCKLCEVELDMDELRCHYETDHKVMQISKVKSLIRLNINDIHEIAASKECNFGADTFTDTKALEDHVAMVHARLFLECKICNKRLEKQIYNDHIKTEHKDVYFKKVDERNTPTKVTEPNESSFERKDAEIPNETEKQQEATISDKRVSFKPQSTKDVPLMYICDACNLVTSSYDNVIAHSQDHILNKATKVPEVCEICDLKFDADFAIHRQMHLSNNDLDRDSFRFVSYDFKNLTSDKWLDMFDAFTRSKVNRVISASIYFSTRCVCLKLLRDCKHASAQFTLFQCLTCTNYVDSESLESHVAQRNTCTSQSFSYQCVKCAKTFYTAEGSDEHMKTHDVPDCDSKYRTVLFNDPDDFSFNKKLLEAGGKSALFKKEVTTRPQPEKRVIDKDVAGQTPANKATVVTSETNKPNPKVVTDVEHKVGNEHKGVTDAANKVANNHKIASKTKVNEGKVADVYKCSCGLCFHRLNSLLTHMQNCATDTTKIAKITCACGLVFDSKNFAYHCKAHCRDITTFNVKRLILVDDTQIDVSGMNEKSENGCKP